MRNLWIILILVLMMIMNVQALSEINFNFLDESVINSGLFNLTLDQITDIYGKPDYVEPEIVSKNDYYGSLIKYYEKGLVFRFMHSKEDSNRRCKEVNIYLCPKKDIIVNTTSNFHYSGMFFQSYKGKLPYDISADWKVSRLMEIFVEFKPEESFSEEIREALKPLKNTPIDKELYDNTWFSKVIKFNSYKVDFYYEPTTKFIEKIRIVNTIKK